jgi:hypothetical protein
MLNLDILASFDVVRDGSTRWLAAQGAVRRAGKHANGVVAVYRHSIRRAT